MKVFTDYSELFELMYGKNKYLHEEYEYIFNLCKPSSEQNGDMVPHDLSKDDTESAQKTTLSIKKKI